MCSGIVAAAAVAGMWTMRVEGVGSEEWRCGDEKWRSGERGMEEWGVEMLGVERGDVGREGW